MKNCKSPLRRDKGVVGASGGGATTTTTGPTSAGKEVDAKRIGEGGG